MPEDPTYKRRRCPKCTERNAQRKAKVLANGTCLRCNSAPADETLTTYAACSIKRRSKSTSTSPSRDQGWSGIVRWLLSGRMREYVRFVPSGVSLVVDLFGGSASFSAEVSRCSSAKVVYNDVHPTLCDLLREAQESRGDEVCRRVQSLMSL